jgi:hypothetical protein
MQVTREPFMVQAALRNALRANMGNTHTHDWVSSHMCIWVPVLVCVVSLFIHAYTHTYICIRASLQLES